MPPQRDVEAEVKRLVAEICAVDVAKIRSDRPLIDVGLDSARAIDLVVSLEESFDIQIKDADAAKLRTIADLVAYVTEKRNT